MRRVVTFTAAFLLTALAIAAISYETYIPAIYLAATAFCLCYENLMEQPHD